MKPPSIALITAKEYRDEWKRTGGPRPVTIQIDTLPIRVIERQTRTGSSWFLECPGCRKPRRSLIRLIGNGALCRWCLGTDLGRKPRRKRPSILALSLAAPDLPPELWNCWRCGTPLPPYRRWLCHGCGWLDEPPLTPP